MAYHHGSVRPAAIRSALRFVRRHGAKALSLRAVADDVGVSSQALYRHFAGLDEILFDVAREAVVELADRLGDEASLAELGERYVRWAIDEPHLFQLAFGEDGLGNGALGPMFEAGPPPQQLFMRAADDPDEALAHWVVAHGVATLAVDGLLGEATVTPLDALDRIRIRLEPN
ncbi:MAG: TetR/AcrR family transcriptional regulator [Acidimicrobiia bacterium]